MDTLIGLFGIVVASTAWLVLLIGSCLLTSSSSDKGRNMWWHAFGCIALFWTIVERVVFTETQLFILGCVWVPVGVIWVLAKWYWRVKRVKHQVSTFDELKYLDFDRLKESINVDEQKSVIALWFIFWPVSMVCTFTIDIGRTVEYLIAVQFGSVFKKMAGDTLSDIDSKHKKYTDSGR